MSLIRHMLVLELMLGLLGSVVHHKNKYFGRYNVFTYNLIFYIGLGGREWVDGIGWVQMTTSELGRCSLVRARFCS